MGRTGSLRSRKETEGNGVGSAAEAGVGGSVISRNVYFLVKLAGNAS